MSDENQQHKPANESEKAGLDMLNNLETDTAAQPGDNAPGPQPDVPTKDILAPVVDLLCNLVTAALGADEIPAENKTALSESYAAVIDKHFPGNLFLSVEFNALLITASTFGPIVIQSRLKKRPPNTSEKSPGKDPAAKSETAPEKGTLMVSDPT